MMVYDRLFCDECGTYMGQLFYVLVAGDLPRPCICPDCKVKDVTGYGSVPRFSLPIVQRDKLLSRAMD